jgi:hypothetical protein
MKILAIAAACPVLSLSAAAGSATPNVAGMHAFGHCAAERGLRSIIALAAFRNFRAAGG